MVDIAELGIKVTSKGVAESAKGLNDLKQAAKSSERELKELEKTSDKTSRELDDLGDSGDKAGAGLKALKVGAAAAAAATAVLTAAAIKGVKDFAEAERQYLRLEGVLKATGGAAGLTAKQLTEFAGKIQSTTFYTEESVLAAASALATFKSVSGDTFTQAISLAGDMAEVFGGDLSGAATQLGKALEDPTQGLTALRRVGVTFTDEQKNLIESLVETNRQADAQKLILQALSEQMGGAATKAASGLAGSYDNLLDSVGELLESFGEIIANKLGLTDFFNSLGGAVDGLTRRINILFGNINKLSQADVITEIGGKKTERREIERRIKELQSQQGRGGIAGASISGALQQQQKALKEVNDELKKYESALDKTKIVVDEVAGSKSGGTGGGGSRRSSGGGSGGGIKSVNNALNEQQEAAKRAAEELQRYNQSVRDTFDDLTLENEQLERKVKALGMSEEELARISARIEDENELRSKGLKIGSEEEKRLLKEIQRRRELTDALGKQQDALEETKRKKDEEARALSEPIRAAAEDIQRTFTDTFEKIFTGGVNSFGDLADEVKRIFVRLAANLAATQLFGNLNIGGILGGGLSGSGGGSGGAGGIKITDLLGGLKSFSTGGSLPGFLVKNLGISKGLATSLGAAGSGFGVGGLLSGLMGGNSTVGGLAGGALQGIGAALGLTGPAGLALGALGGLIGGAFGKKPSDKTQGGALIFGTGETSLTGFTGKKFSQENANARDAILQAVGTLANTIAGDRIKELEGFFVNVGSRDGLRYRFGAGADIKAGSQSELFSGVSGSIAKQINLAQELQDAISKIDFKDLEKGFADLQFVMNFDKLGEAPKKVNELEEAVKQINEAFDTAVTTANRLGLSEQKVNDARQKQLGILRSEFDESIGDRILGITDSNALALKTLDQDYKDLIRSQEAVGGNRALVDQLYNLEKQKIIGQMVDAIYEKQIQSNQEEIKRLNTQLQTQRDMADEAQRLVDAYDGILSNLSAFKNSIMLDARLSPLSGRQRVDTARDIFNQTLSRAMGGDLKAFDDLEGNGRALLDASRSYYASSEDYFKDFELVRQALDESSKYALSEREISKMQLDASTRQVELLEEMIEALNNQSSVFSSQNTTLIALLSGKQASSVYQGQMDTLGRSLAEEQPGLGITRGQFQSIGRALGFQGNYGAGEHGTYLQQTGTKDLFNSLISIVTGGKRYAAGGNTGVGSALVGEYGAELATFNSPAHIHSANATRSMMSQAGNDNNRNSGYMVAYSKMMTEQNERMIKRLESLELAFSRMERSLVRAVA